MKVALDSAAVVAVVTFGVLVGVTATLVTPTDLMVVGVIADAMAKTGVADTRSVAANTTPMVEVAAILSPRAAILLPLAGWRRRVAGFVDGAERDDGFGTGDRRSAKRARRASLVNDVGVDGVGSLFIQLLRQRRIRPRCASYWNRVRVQNPLGATGSVTCLGDESQHTQEDGVGRKSNQENQHDLKQGGLLVRPGFVCVHASQHRGR